MLRLVVFLALIIALKKGRQSCSNYCVKKEHADAESCDGRK